jgi:hypothetical protein
MKRGVVLSAVAAWFGSACVSTAADAGPSFDARRDAYRVSDCLRAYKLLEEAAMGLKPDVFQAYEHMYVVSWKRIGPFADASARAVGDRQFYSHNSVSHFSAERLLESNAIEAESVRNTLVQSLAAEAKACDALVIGWGPPPKVPAGGQ